VKEEGRILRERRQRGGGVYSLLGLKRPEQTVPTREGWFFKKERGTNFAVLTTKRKNRDTYE
jgi:hypothetical protein